MKLEGKAQDVRTPAELKTAPFLGILSGQGKALSL